MPAEGFKAGERTRRKVPAASAEHQVGDRVGDTDEHDQVTEGNDLVSHGDRDGVAEPAKACVLIGDGPGARDDDAIEVAGLDHPGLNECLGAYGGGPVENDGNQVGDDADTDDSHPDDHQVADGEDERRDESGERPPARLRQVELVGGEPDADGERKQRERNDTNAEDRAKSTATDETSREADDDSQNQGRESHGKSSQSCPPTEGERRPGSRGAGGPPPRSDARPAQMPDPRAVPISASPSARST